VKIETFAGQICFVRQQVDFSEISVRKTTIKLLYVLENHVFCAKALSSAHFFDAESQVRALLPFFQLFARKQPDLACGTFAFPAMGTENPQLNAYVSLTLKWSNLSFGGFQCRTHLLCYSADTRL
jgi:hypothetical protein